MLLMLYVIHLRLQVSGDVFFHFVLRSELCSAFLELLPLILGERYLVVFAFKTEEALTVIQWVLPMLL